MFVFAVAPLAGAWIEIFYDDNGERTKQSLPSRERGLKLAQEPAA